MRSILQPGHRVWLMCFFFFSSRRRHTRLTCDWSSDVCSSDLNQGKPLTHRRLLQAVWGPDYGEETESLRVVINQLRKKLETDSAHPKYIVTEPWVGYRFQPPRTGNSKPTARKG